jgi:ribonucleoside-diphosphate reductase alpha chain
MIIYSSEEIDEATLKYFNGDKLATNVWKTKYALKNKSGEYLEKTPKDMHKRLAKEFARIEKKFNKNLLSEENIFQYLDKFKYIVPQGSPMFSIGNDYANTSLSNCVVINSPNDSISSIIESGKELANLFKRRCGVGIDISTLRPEGAQVNNSAGTTSGAWSFADFYSYVCRMIGQNGRRGALMITLDVRHPDVEKFVTMKHDLSKVTGANVSVKISDDFMLAVANDEEYVLRYPVDAPKAKYSKIIKAKELWNLIVNSATETAEPGILMWDNILKNLPANCYEQFKTISTNPCGEIPLSKYDSCRLISVNLKNFVENKFTEQAKFDYDLFIKVTRAATRLSDDIVELEIERLQTIKDLIDDKKEKELWDKLQQSAIEGRRTGLGTHGLADVLSCMRVKYDSEEGIKIIDKIYETFRNAAYEESIELAQQRGTFPVFDWEKEKDNEYINRLPGKLKKLISQHGRRNISILTNAPTGSVSIVSQTSSGIEPVFRNHYTRRRKLSYSDTDVTPDFVDKLGDRWQEYCVFHYNVLEWLKSNNLEMINSEEETLKVLPEYFVASNKIDWNKRVEVQSTIQKYIDHSISSTINLPKGTKASVVSDIYLEGWKRGLKGITVYVDECRDGVLIKEKNKFPQTHAPKRPEVLECDIHYMSVKGEKWTILIGMLDNKPYECLGGLSSYVEIPKKYVKGLLKKNKYKTRNNAYDLAIGEGDDEFKIKDVVRLFDNPNYAAFTRMISLGLRHGAGINYIVEQLQKDKEADMFSFARCVSRVLKTYIKDGTRCGSDKVCGACGQGSLIYKEGCVSCVDCGYSKCE